MAVRRTSGAGNKAKSYEVEIDFGSTPIYSKTFTIVNSIISTNDKIMAFFSSNPATGRVGNDAEWDAISFSSVANAGTFSLTATSINGAVVDRRNIFYTIL